MATNSTFDAMLKRYMPYELLQEELKKRNYFWSKVEKDEDWTGGTLEIPFEAGAESSLQFGSLTSASDIAEGTRVMGTLSTMPELWGTMKFNEKDLSRHGDLEKSYLKIVPDKIDQFVARMSERISIALIGDGSVATATGNGTVGGTIAVDAPELFTIGEKVTIDDSDSTAASGYVTAIDINTKTLTIKNARSAGAAVDLSGYTTAASAKVYLPGAQTDGFTSLKSQLLSSTNGGSTNLFGAAKTTTPFLQAVNIAGSGFTASTVVDDLFSAFYTVAQLGKGMPTEIIVNYGMFKNIAKKLEAAKRYVVADKKVGYGFRSLSVMGPDADMTITAVRGMPSDIAHIVDWKSMKFHGSEFFKRKRHMDGSESFLVRNTTGYEHIVDISFQGDLVVNKPCHNGIIHGIPASVST